MKFNLPLATTLTLLSLSSTLVSAETTSSRGKISRLRTLLNEKFGLAELFANQEQITELDHPVKRSVSEEDNNRQELEAKLKKKVRNSLKAKKVLSAQVCRTKCAINKLDRVACNEKSPNGYTGAYKCKKSGCCFDAEDKQCYKPAARKCPVPRCEAVKVSERTVLGRYQQSKKTCRNCWDNRRSQCFKKSEPVCDAGKVNEVCGWGKIGKNQCLGKSHCCWHDAQQKCFKATVSENNALNELIEASFKKTTEKPATTTVYERSTKVVPKNVDDEMSSKDLEVADVIYRCPSLNEDLYVCAIGISKTDCENVFGCCHFNDLYGKPACVARVQESIKIELPVPTLSSNQIERSANLPKTETTKKTEATTEEAAAAPLFVVELETNDAEHSSRLNNVEMQFLQPNSIITPNDMGSSSNDDTINVILAQQESKRRCSEMFSDTKSKNYKRCVLFLLPDILEKLECTDCDFINLENQGNDYDMTQTLKTLCLADIDSIELCKVVALSGRPFKNVRNEMDSMQLLNFDRTDQVLSTLLNSDVGKDDLLPMLLATGDGLSTNQMLKKLVISKTTTSLEAQVLTKLLTDTANMNSLLQIPAGPTTDCYQTLMINVLNNNYPQYSYLTSTARNNKDKTSCESAGHCWTEYSIDSIVASAYGGVSKDKFTNLFAFAAQMDRILGPERSGFFDAKCVKKAPKSMLTMSTLSIFSN